MGLSFGDEVSIVNCSNCGNISVARLSGGPELGGILGSDGCDYINVVECSNTADIYTYCGWTYVGGIVGDSCADDGLFEGCYNSGNITSYITFDKTGESCFVGVGGVFGYAGGPAIINCYNNGDIFATCGPWAEVGGFAAGLSGLLKSCYNSGNVYIEKVYNIQDSDFARLGGFAGYLSDDVEDCFNSGDIIVREALSSQLKIGGFFGENVGLLGETKNCYTIR